MTHLIDIPKAFRIKEIVRNSVQVVTLVLEGTLNSIPGQFVMLWLPEVDEKPISISLDSPEKNELHLSIADIGPVTHKFCEEMKVGDSLGIRGPYGSTFCLSGEAKQSPESKPIDINLTQKKLMVKDSGQAGMTHKKVAMVGGGCGCAPMRFLAYEARKKNIAVDYYVGVRSKDLVLFEAEMQSIGCNVFVSTDDGTHGHKGFITQVLEQNLNQQKVDKIYTCGPEMMMKIVAEIAEKFNIPSEVSIERYMKCGFGICGQCCLDDSGLRLCKEGPIISGERALASPEFGNYHRDKMGIKYNF